MKSLYLKYGILENRYLVGAFLLGTVMQVGVVAFEPIAQIFKLVPLNNTQWIYTILISFVPLIVMELQKKWNEFKFGKVIYQSDHL